MMDESAKPGFVIIKDTLDEVTIWTNVTVLNRTPLMGGIDSVKRNSLRRTATVCDYDLRHFLFGAFIPDHSAPRPFDSQ